MSQYRRFYVPGGTYFFTVRCHSRQATYLTDHIDLLRAATRVTMNHAPFTIDTAVILPDHLHMIWTLPVGDSDFSSRWRLLKATFSRHMPTPLDRTAVMKKRGEKGIWQRRFWEHVIRDADDLTRHRAFAHAAPVRAGLCARPQDWVHSTAQRQRATAFAFGPI
ncbi:transposase [Nereida sp. MMG025]|uniref:REP-associated tyrosine transposase n=1 Tax=Nereida sp. MMG025 TaxID=2909981 RepID=UPI001F22C758|nr:transposase [Nereida sp. MMG025]MCF6445608.1 transposase [Nereida sp. MMG025]